MDHKVRLAVRLALLVLIMTAIFVFSSQPADESQKLSDGLLDRVEIYFGFLFELGGDPGKSIRKYAHFMEYMSMGVFSALFFAELYISAPKRLFRTGIVSIALCVLYACSDEIHQLFVPGRACRAADVCTDGAGALIGTAAVLAYYKLKIRKAGNSNNGYKPFR